MADFSSSASGSAAGRRSLLQRFQSWLRPGAAPQPRRLVSMRPNGADPYLGEIALFAGNFAPVGWEFCNGQLLPISEYDALFNLINTTYGGDGQTTFALPDLRSRVPLGQGTGAGLTAYSLGQKGGAETSVVTTSQLPPHTHTVAASTAPGTTASPQGSFLADSGSGSAQYTQATTNLVTQPSQTTAPVGGGGSHNNMQPYLTVHYIIATQGIFPSPD